MSKIQSMSDIITNSSSEVFIVSTDNHEKVINFINDVCEVCGWNTYDLMHFESADEFVAEWVRYGSDILYHVLLPLMPSGRSQEGVSDGTFEYLEYVIEQNKINNVAFGAHFIKNLRNSRIKTWLYDEQSFSKNVILTPNKVQITPSSFDLNPIQIVEV